jgi:mRNA-degrading endonuclease RelE of RelBE toxin-antitoxin system
MQLIITPSALKALNSMPKADAKRLIEALQTVADQHPQRMSYVTEIAEAPGLWRARKGDYCAAYRITETSVVVETAGHRKDIYR